MASSRSDDEPARAEALRAVAALYDRFGGQAYSLALQICRDEAVAEAVVVEVFLEYRRSPELLDTDVNALVTWILVAVHRRSVDAVRADATRRLPDAAPLRALDRLPAAERRALTLVYFDGFTRVEVAAMTGTTPESVMAAVRAGLRRLGGKTSPAGDTS